jgi:hypothetical protein
VGEAHHRPISYARSLRWQAGRTIFLKLIGTVPLALNDQGR